MQEEGWSQRDVKRELRRLRSRDFSFEKGEILGSMCTAPDPVAREAHDLFLATNLGDPGHFPGSAEMEHWVLDEIKSLVRAPPHAGARFLSGGTEANLLACAVARERSVGPRGNKRRVVVLPDSAHFSFEKAARLLELELRYVRTDGVGRADPVAMGKAIGRDTMLLVAVAGTTEMGLVDPIEPLSRLALAKKVPLHVDAALGGYLLPFLEDAGRIPRPFDFTLPGVWSLSLDPHKMAMSTIPGGVLVLRDENDWRALSVTTPYVSTDSQTTLLGTRPGAPVAAAWAVHRHLGRLGFAGVAEDCLDNATYLAAKLQEQGWSLVAQPDLNVVALRVDDPLSTARRLQDKGFRVNVMARHSALRIVCMPHVTRRVLDKFLAALGHGPAPTAAAAVAATAS